LLTLIGSPVVLKSEFDFWVAATEVAVVAGKTVGDLFDNLLRATMSAIIGIAEIAENVSNGFRFIVKKTKEFAGATANELQQVMESGKAMLDDAGNVILVRFVNDKYVIAATKGVGDGVVIVWDVATWIPQGLFGAVDQLGTKIGYGSDCGDDVHNGPDRNHPINPIDELDTSCFVHDDCLRQRTDSTLPPISHNPQTRACNDRLIADAWASDCHRSVGSQIRIQVPEEQPIPADPIPRYHLPQGGPPLTVQPTADTGAISHCTANRPAIITVFSVGRAAVNMIPPSGVA
jgi:hypothetical protein